MKNDPGGRGHANAEAIELKAMLAWFHANARLDLATYDWRVERVGDALCSVCPTDPSILMNRVFGCGSQAPPTLERLVAIRRLYRQSGIERFFLHLTPETLAGETEQVLAEAGYERYRGWMKFVRGTAEPGDVPSDLSVRRTGPEHAADFAAIAAPAFDMAPASEPVISALATSPGWHMFMSFDGDQPAGTGAIFIRDDVAYTDWGATHPDYRRRGSQTAVLNARIRYALEAGCNMIVTMTGEAVGGDPQHSYNNILKRGFEEAYLRENWIPVER